MTVKTPLRKPFALTLSYIWLTMSAGYAETDNHAELDKVATYLAAGMACTTVSEQNGDEASQQLFGDLVNDLVDKTFFYSADDQAVIRELSISKTEQILTRADIDDRCATLAQSLKS